MLTIRIINFVLLQGKRMFFEENAALLEAFAKVSGIAGARADYVQGGGGNTSVKLADGLMAIKASGFCLKDIEKDYV